MRCTLDLGYFTCPACGWKSCALAGVDPGHPLIIKAHKAACEANAMERETAEKLFVLRRRAHELRVEAWEVRVAAGLDDGFING